MCHLLRSVFGPLIVICLILFVFFGCSDFEVPEHLVVEHVKQIVKTEVGNGFDLNITSSLPGEGDADTIYQHIEFDIVARSDQQIRWSGWSKLRNVRKGQILMGGEVVIFYQRDNHHWKLIRYWINKTPS